METRFMRLLLWARITPGLEPLYEDTRLLWAVAQHYGLPTNYLDFTIEPRVAAFFATHGNEATKDHDCCLFCFNSEHFRDEIEELWTLPNLRDIPMPELVHVQVENLWRLEAQAGRFLLTPVDVEHVYAFMRIDFPCSHSSQEPRREDVYPTRRSHLEILLGQHLENERLLRERPILVEQMKQAGALDFSDVTDDLVGEILALYGQSRTQDMEKALPHPSWETLRLAAWLDVPHETWSAVRLPLKLHLQVSPEAPADRVREKVTRHLSAFLARHKDARSRLLAWSFDLSLPSSLPEQPQGEELDSGRLREWSQCLKKWAEGMWDGIRRLPYSEEQIASSVALCVALGLVKLREPALASQECVTRVLEEPLCIEVTGTSGGYSRGYVATGSLRRALREDVQFSFKPISELGLGDLHVLLIAEADPRKLFDFNRLADVFVREYVPSQAVTRIVEPHLYSPARLIRLGLP
jgi:hypothetical protein